MVVGGARAARDVGDTRILVSDAETRAVVATVRGLRAGGFTVAAAGSARPAPALWSRAVSERLVVPHPLTEERAFVDALVRVLASSSYAVLLPGSDASLLAMSAARDRLAAHVSLPLPRHEVVVRSLEKIALEPLASRHGIASPPTVVCGSISEAVRSARELGFPVVVKPPRSIVERDGARRRVGSIRVDNQASLEVAARLLGGRCLVQGIEQGTALSFAGVFVEGQLLAEAVSKYHRTWYPEAGNAAFSETVKTPPELRGRVTGLLGDLGWEGLFELELIARDDGEWAAIDFNPRPYGSLALAIGAGANLPAVWCAHALGRRPAPVAAIPGVRYRWEDADFRHALWFARRGDARAAARAFRPHRGVVHAYSARDDPGPAAARAVELARSTWRRAVMTRPGSRTEDRLDPDAPAVPAKLRRRPSKSRDDGLPVVVIGAGPFGIATTAHLRAAGLSVRTFGKPFDFWRHHMPEGMILRSRRRATHIADPHRQLTIDQFERSTGRTCPGASLTLEEFIDYGTWFQQRAVPDLDQRMVERVARDGRTFMVTLADGEQVAASRVVVAAGLGTFAWRPPPFAPLPRSHVSHASDHEDLGAFAGRRVAVIGGGQSALESAALLNERGASVEVISRSPALTWLGTDHIPLQPHRVRVPIPLPPTGVGGRVSGWIAALPDAFRRTPLQLRPWLSARCLVPAGSGWLRPRMTGVEISCGRATVEAQAQNGDVRLLLDDGSERVVDHVLLGTGYAVDVTRYQFLAPELVEELDTVRGCPRLGPGLESSVEGLHFVGAPAVWSFGPVMRFVVGSWYAAPAVALRALGRRQALVRFAF